MIFGGGGKAVFRYRVVGAATALATFRNGWDKRMLFTISSILGYLGKESKTVGHLDLGLWPTLKFCTCIANVVMAKQLAC